MFEDDAGNESFDETLRSIARELGRSVERMVDSVDPDEIADAIGVDADAAREWVESAGNWLRGRTESLGNEVSLWASVAGRRAPREDPLRGAAPHPLDLPTEEQGLAMAALDSGRWTVESGTDALAINREGPGPSDALGIVRELRVRDWIVGDGELTLAGRHALRRWLEAERPH